MNLQQRNKHQRTNTPSRSVTDSWTDHHTYTATDHHTYTATDHHTYTAADHHTYTAAVAYLLLYKCTYAMWEHGENNITVSHSRRYFLPRCDPRERVHEWSFQQIQLCDRYFCYFVPDIYTLHGDRILHRWHHTKGSEYFNDFMSCLATVEM